MKLATSFVFIGAILLLSAEGFSFFQTESKVSRSPKAASNSSPPTPATSHQNDFTDRSRRDAFASIMGAAIGGAAVLSSPAPALAAADCMKDCIKNCLIIAPQVSLTSRGKNTVSFERLTSKHFDF
jgi:hypothetical protein